MDHEIHLDKILSDLHNANEETQHLLDMYNQMLKEKGIDPSEVDEILNSPSADPVLRSRLEREIAEFERQFADALKAKDVSTNETNGSSAV